VTRVCLDMNVLVAAFVSRGLCADLLRMVVAEHDLVEPGVVADELRRVLTTKFAVASLTSVEAVLERCESVTRGTEPCPIDVRDRDDARVLADALRGDVDFLVTGDRDLLSVAGESPIPILSPRAFMTLARGGSG